MYTNFTRSQIRATVISLLTGATIAGSNVNSSRSAPMQDSQFPFINVYLPRESSESLATAGTDPEYRTTLTITFQLGVRGDTDASVESQLDALIDTTKNTLLTNPAFVDYFSHLGNMSLDIEYDDKEHKHKYATGVLTIDGIYEEQYPQNITQDFGGVNLHVDALNVYDPSGTYSPQFSGVAPTAAPRTIGPDGRDEISAQIDVSES